jgi:hypothetical protein
MNKLLNKQMVYRFLTISSFVFVSAVLTLWAWNSAMTTIFGLPVIHFKEALGIIILAYGISIVFKPGRNHVNHLTGPKS